MINQLISHDAAYCNLKLFGLESRSDGFCLRRTSVVTSMAALDGDCVVQVVGAFLE